MSFPFRHRSRWSPVVGLLLALAVLPIEATPASAASGSVQANCSVNLRTSTSSSSPALTVMPTGTVITYTGVVSGSAWSGGCAATASGSTWYAISAVNAKSVASLYGVTVAYAATGMFRPVEGTAVLEGVDVSRWQGTVDFGAVRNSGRRFVVAKATEGIGYLDPNYLSYKAGASGAGLRVSAYHFARPDLNPTNPQGEADWFVSSMGLVPGMLVPALDLEVAGTLGTTGLIGWVGTWLDRVYAKTGIRPMIYTSPSFWKKYLADTTTFADKGYSVLWVAHWGVLGPTVPAKNWSNRGWTFWQYDNCGTVPGISGCVDLDRYNGTDLTPVTFGANYNVSVSPASVSVRQGSGTALTVSLGRSFFTTAIDLSVAGLPAGTTAAFGSTHVTGSSTSLSIATTAGSTPTPIGTYKLTITAKSRGLTRTAIATLAVTDGLPPKVTAPVYGLVYPAKMGFTTAPVRVAWSATDPKGISSYHAQRSVNGGSWAAVTLPSAVSTTSTPSLAFGTGYQYAANATDGAGNTSSWATGRHSALSLTQQSSTAIKYGGTWSTASNTYASGGSLKYAGAAGASASYAFTGSGIAWVAYRGPNRGSASVYVDGIYRATINLYSSTYSSKAIAFAFNWSTVGTHTIKIVCLGTTGHARIDLDAFIRLTLS